MGPKINISELTWLSKLNFRPAPSFISDELLLSIYSPLMYLITFVYASLMLSLLLMSVSKTADDLISQAFTYVEKELNSPDDLMFTLVLFLSVFFFHVFGCFSILSSFGLNQIMFYLVSVLCFFLVLVPTIMLYNFGFYFIMSVRGSSVSLSSLYELVLDYINFISFYLRLCIQLVRLVIITVTFYGYNHLFLTYNFDVYSVSVSNIITDSTTLTVMLLRLVFEAGHVFIMFAAQLGAFLLMVI